MKQYEPSLIQTPFGASSTAAEVIEGIDLSAQRVTVTDGSSGLGVETARALAAAGAEVTLAVRNTQAAEGWEKQLRQRCRALRPRPGRRRPALGGIAAPAGL